MWGKRWTAGLIIAVVAATGGVGPVGPARASGPGEAIWGDVDGDGFRDRVYLGSVQPDRCSVIVEYGRPFGVLLPPAAYTYLRPGGTGVDINCPDIGVAVDLTTGPLDALVIGWSGGPPASIDHNLQVLGRNFMPSFGLTTTVRRPRFMGTEDFNGDGRPDVYSVGPDDGLESYYSLGDGTLTPGPERWCASSVDYVLKDFNRDGAMAALIAFTGGCADGSSGVVKVSSDGAVQTLQHDPANTRTWQAKIAYADGDSLADIRTRALDTGEVEYFIQVPGGSVATFVKSPTAVQDKVTISGDRATNLVVLDNDYATETAGVSIVEQPKYGSVQVTSSRTVVYRPNATHRPGDRFVYRITEGTKTSNAAVNIRFSG
jgi:hypothetical protein